jgi:sialate O-acetylesterase
MKDMLNQYWGTQRLYFLGFLCLINACSHQKSELRVADIFTNHMVLQQEVAAPIWGWARPNTEITISTSWSAQVHTYSNDLGKWKITMRTPKTDAQPQWLKIMSVDSIIFLDDVLLGEVWIGSGQSNMEMPMNGWTDRGDFLNDSQNEIKNANYSKIRLFRVNKVQAYESLQQLDGNWAICSPETVPNFSAVLYFFGRELHENIETPIGLIDASWDGSSAQAWVAPDYLEKIKGFEKAKEKLTLTAREFEPFNDWISEMKQIPRDEFIGAEAFRFESDKTQPYVRSNYDDSGWDTVSHANLSKVFGDDFDGDDLEGYDINGVVWFRQEFQYSEDIRSDSLAIFLGPVTHLNSTFLNGNLIGRKEHWGSNQGDVVYKIPSKELKKGKNVLTVRVIDVWGTAGFKKGVIPKILDDQNMELIALQDYWKFKRSAVLFNNVFHIIGDDEQVRELSLRMTIFTPASMFNGMIAPLIPFAIKGVVWYQGETNVSRPLLYQTLFPAVFNSWRSHWRQGDFPFYYAQLSSYGGFSHEVSKLREAQRFSLKEKNVGMAVTIDIGDYHKIHAHNKQDVGKRLALWALAKDYGDTSLVYSGPLYKEVTFEGANAIISFDHVGSGLDTRKKLPHFEMAGSDKIFYPAKAYITNNQVIARADQVKMPIFVRYAWLPYIEANLYNLEGLPAAPFRTDTNDEE